MNLEAPFPWFGAKSKVADIVWQRFGDVYNYVEPFFGSGAVLLGRPEWHKRSIETVNDLDGFIANFWRAIQHDPEKTASYADYPVNEADLTARHLWLVKQKEELLERLEGNPDYYDAKIAGYWSWGICCWLGSGWCSGDGPWIADENGKLVKGEGQGVSRSRPNLRGRLGVNRSIPSLINPGKGVNRKIPHLTRGGRGVTRPTQHIYDWFELLSSRLRRVRVCCGDWSRVLGPSPTWVLGQTGVFLDPPYSLSERCYRLYNEEKDIGREVATWAIANGDNPLMRIALCGYKGEHEMPESWSVYRWKTVGGYGTQGDGRGRANRERETIWFSPHCLKAEQLGLI